MAYPNYTLHNPGKSSHLFLLSTCKSTNMRDYLLLCLFTSYISTPAATEAFKDDIRPSMGILTRKSHFSLTSRPRPLPSLPTTRARGPVKSLEVYVSPSISAPATHKPCLFSRSKVSEMLVTLATGT